MAAAAGVLALAVAVSPASAVAAGPRIAEAPRSPARPALWLAVRTAALRLEPGWDISTGGDAGLGWTRRGALAWVAVGAGGLLISAHGGGRVALEGALGWRGPAGTIVGIEAGPTLELDRVRPPRRGAQVGVWLFAGITPYLRLSMLERTGKAVEVGLCVPFPTLGR